MDLPKLMSFLSTRETNSKGNDHDLQVPLLHHQLSFPSLKTLQLAGLPKIKHVWSKEIFRFPDLFNLHVAKCENLKSLFPAATVATSLTQLKSLKIRDCGVLEEIVQREDGTDPTTRILFTSLTSLSLDGLPKLKWFFQGVRTLESSSSKELHEQGGTLFGVNEVGFPSLKLLDLYGLPKIKHVWSKDSQTIPSFQNLQVIIVGKCVSLKSLFPASIVRCLEQLEKIKIYDCGVEEIVAAEEGEAVEMTLVFPQVTSLCLENLERLEGVHDSKWSMLKEMRILECEKVKLLFPSLVMDKLEIMSRNVTIQKLWGSCYARCLHAMESYRLRSDLMKNYILWNDKKMFTRQIVRSIKAHHQSAPANSTSEQDSNKHDSKAADALTNSAQRNIADDSRRLVQC
ncbi:uncharacterized protein LOC121262411 [Juglans microcarpa x Juglans regia]|uniref:uncharacterized protein LOC121262411 n=1 Tax=Juglans microcarpa x Juglans regia TaxID=2249226 RepID=UPI001B7E31AA|nr:uncharacterized protein LOC121262411 [Juglans microcarpa x Juglans regia]